MFATVVVTLTHEPSVRCSSCVNAPLPYGWIPSCLNFIATMFAMAPCSWLVGDATL